MVREPKPVPTRIGCLGGRPFISTTTVQRASNYVLYVTKPTTGGSMLRMAWNVGTSPGIRVFCAGLDAGPVATAVASQRGLAVTFWLSILVDRCTIPCRVVLDVWHMQNAANQPPQHAGDPRAICPPPQAVLRTIRHIQ